MNNLLRVANAPRCQACGERQTRIRDGVGRFSVVECAACGFRSVSHAREDLLREGHLPSDDDTRSRRLVSFDFSDPSVLKATKRAFLRQLERIERYVSVGKMLDVGCGTGWFLKSAEARGWEVTGVEPQETLGRYARERLGLHVVQGRLEEVPLPARGFDVVKARHVVEHAADPGAFVKKAYALLRHGGVLNVEVPNENSLWLRLHRALHWLGGGRNGSTLNPPLHLHGFTPCALRRLLARSGFEVLQVFTAVKGDRTWFAWEPDIDSRATFFDTGVDRWVKAGVRIVEALSDQGFAIVAFARKPGHASRGA